MKETTEPRPQARTFEETWGKEYNHYPYHDNKLVVTVFPDGKVSFSFNNSHLRRIGHIFLEERNELCKQLGERALAGESCIDLVEAAITKSEEREQKLKPLWDNTLDRIRKVLEEDGCELTVNGSDMDWSVSYHHVSPTSTYVPNPF